MTLSEIKKLSLRINKQHFLNSFIITVFLIVTTVVFSILPYIITSTKNYFDIKNGLILSALCLVSFGYSIIFSSYLVGKKAWYAGRMSKSKLGFKRMLFWFKLKYSFKAFRFKLILTFLKFVTVFILTFPSTLIINVTVILAFSGGIEAIIFISLLIGGITLLLTGVMFAFTLNQRYFLAEYLYINNPRLSVIQTIKRSKNLLEGHIFEVVKFKLSFVPVFLTNILIIPIFFTVPYYKQSCCILAKELCI